MTTMEKRKKLDEFCESTPVCNGCPLNIGGFTCGIGFSFISTYICDMVSDDEVEKAYELVFESVPEPAANPVPESTTIKDSGERTEFDSGAVRDMHEGKGRCDLMPLDVAAQLMGGRNDDASFDCIIDEIDTFQHTCSIERLYCAVEKFAQARYGSNANMLLEVAKHFEEGAKKYGENNWQKGIPVRSYIDSAVRHYLKWLRGDKDERHDRAFCWNIMCAIWTCTHMPELNDYCRKEEEHADN